MSLQISHVLINVNDLGTLLINLIQKALNQLCEIRELFLDNCMILLVLSSDMSKKLFEMLRIVHNQLVDDRFVEINAWEFIGVTFDDNRCHQSEVF